MLIIKKEGQLTLFFLIVGYCLLLKTISSNLLVWWLSLLSLLAAALMSRPAGRQATTVFAALTCLFAMTVIGFTLSSSSLTATEDYIALSIPVVLLVTVFMYYRRPAELYFYTALIFVLLAVWGVAQHVSGVGYLVQYGDRANALFNTPNTFAAGLNLILLPVVVAYAMGQGRTRWLLFVFLLLLALLATESRGGWIAFGGALALFFILQRVYGFSVSGKRVIHLGLVALFSLVLYQANQAGVFAAVFDRQKAGDTVIDYTGSGVVERFSGHALASSGGHRLAIYEQTLDSIWQQPLSGYGVLAFDDYFPGIKPATYPGWVDFVHNDYLQIAWEMGLPVLGLLLLLIAALLYQTHGLLSLDSLDKPHYVVAAIVAVSAFLAHALVDFLWYIPALLMIAGCYMGYLNQRYSEEAVPASRDNGSAAGRFMSTAARLVVIVIVVGLLLRVALSQVFYLGAAEQQEAGDLKNARELYELAISLDQSPEYYHGLAQLMFKQALTKNNAEYLQRARDVYRRAIESNPLDVLSYYRLAQINHHFRQYLDSPADYETINSWLDRVLELRPEDANALSLKREVRNAETAAS